MSVPGDVPPLRVGRIATYEEATALSRHGALTRPTFEKPRGTRATAAAARTPIPGHYFPVTPAELVVPAEPFRLAVYLCTTWMGIDAETRRAAIDVVGEFGDASCVPVLSSVLHDDLLGNKVPVQDTLTRCAAAHALASIGGPEAETALWCTVESTVYPMDVRGDALLGLLDMLMPDGWGNYTFMNDTKVILPTDVRVRLRALRDFFPYIESVIATCDITPGDEDRS